MPLKLYDPTKPTFYLDQSTLSYAFKGEGPFDALQAWVQRVAEEANLCLTLSHFFELSQIESLEQRVAMAAWLDSLPWVACHHPHHIEGSEAEYWLKKAARIEPAQKVLPFVPAMPMIPEGFMWWGHSFVEMLELAEEQIDVWSARNRAESLVHVDVLREDTHGADERGWSKSRRQQHTAYLRRVFLRKLALETHDRLVAAKDPEYAGKESIEPMELFQGYVLRTRQALPWIRVSWAYLGQYRHVASTLEPGTPGYLAQKSSLADRVHLLGAAYCDVFTCDGLVARFLGDLRTKLGFKHPQITLKGKKPEAFVAALVATWPPKTAPPRPLPDRLPGIWPFGPPCPSATPCLSPHGSSCSGVQLRGLDRWIWLWDGCRGPVFDEGLVGFGSNSRRNHLCDQMSHLMTMSSEPGTYSVDSKAEVCSGSNLDSREVDKLSFRWGQK